MYSCNFKVKNELTKEYLCKPMMLIVAKTWVSIRKYLKKISIIMINKNK